MAKVGRNQPCPCGSGKKYKRCCEATTTRATPITPKAHPEARQPEPTTPWPRWVPWVLGALGIGASLTLVLRGDTRTALAIGGATGLLVGGWYLFTDPPAPRGDGADPAGLNFGRRQD